MLRFKKINLFFSIAVVSVTIKGFAQLPIGNWREHLTYKNTIQVIKGDKIYCATATNFFSINANAEATHYSKINGLSETGVNAIGWDDATQQVVVAYSNSNIDIVKNGIVKNINDIKRSTIAANKAIYQVYCANGLAYLSTGLGIIVVNCNRYEIKDTWVIGNNGAYIKTNGFTANNTSYFAATDQGLKTISITSGNPANFANWASLSGSNGLSSGAVQNVVFCNQQIVVQKNDSLFILNGNTWNYLWNETGSSINNVSVSGNKLLLCLQSNGISKVIQLNTNGTVEKSITQPGLIINAKNALADNNTIWVADFTTGLSNFSNTVQSYSPNGPMGIATGQLLFNQEDLYVAAGSVNNLWQYLLNKNGIYTFTNNSWDNIGYYNKPVLDSVLDFITLANDPTDGSFWAGSFGGGLVNISSNNIKIYKQYNSSLQTPSYDPKSCRVSGLSFDNNNNLWICNYGAAKNLSVRKADGSFKSFTIPTPTPENSIGPIVADDFNQLWMILPKSNSVYCYNYGSSVDDTSDDRWKLFQQGVGLGNLPGNTVLCLAKDKNSFIWIGTDNGIAIVQCTADAFSQNCDAVWPVVKQDLYAGYLLMKEWVQAIAVDGANRKWVGTKNGVWLISAEGNQVIAHFNTDNSPLLDNNVNNIGINPVSGEVFFSTALGVCSYRSTATEGSSTNSNVLVFPNPVPPGYNGTIAIRGLVDNALVKIAEPNGRLVFQTMALGGQAVWNGRNYKGEKIASGVYLVLVTDDTNTEHMATKIIIVSGR
ncbi:MAG: hypothetical protein J0I09_09585 [Sphingobacteriia bacterium]|nr:hypothetical protein [Sphingobacteriia bacterium]